MGFFGWLGSLVDQLIDWLGKALSPFINALVNAISNIWENRIFPALKEAFGYAVGTFYMIIYSLNSRIITELWPKNSNQPTQGFEIKGLAPPSTHIPPRGETRILEVTTN